MNKDTDCDFCRDLFGSNCINLDPFMKMYCSAGYSDREVVDVLCKLIKKIIEKQSNPKLAMNQVMVLLGEHDN